MKGINSQKMMEATKDIIKYLDKELSYSFKDRREKLQKMRKGLEKIYYLLKGIDTDDEFYILEEIMQFWVKWLEQEKLTPTMVTEKLNTNEGFLSFIIKQRNKNNEEL